MNVRSIFEIQKNNLQAKEIKANDKLKKHKKSKANLDDIVANQQMSRMQSIYPDDFKTITPLTELQSGEKDHDEDEIFKNKEATMLPTQMYSIESDNQTAYETERIVKAVHGVSASSLHEFIPVTKLRG